MLILFTIIYTFYYAFPRLANIRLLLSGMTLTALFLSSIIAINSLHIGALGNGITVLFGSFNVSAINLLLGAFMFLLASIILLSFPKLNIHLPAKYNIKEAIISKYNDYVILALFSTIGSFMLMSATNLLVIYLAVELQSFGVYLLAAMSKESESSTSAGLKYFLLGSLASGIILLGLGLIYSFTGLINLDDIYALYSVSYNQNILSPVNIGLALVVIGLLFKIAAAPLHY
jgi:NADH-ubiquinone oxidoreductase chain 2